MPPESASETAGSGPPPAVAQSQGASGLLPRLDGACATVVGADATSQKGIAVREFWKAYFAESGATLPEGNYRLIATGEMVGGCG